MNSAHPLRGGTLLRSKMQPPPAPGFLLPRESLDDLLQVPQPVSLILVQAPAGYGKTTLVADRLYRRDARVAWLQLDEQDNVPGRFVAYLAETLQQNAGLCPQTVEQIRQLGITEAEAVLGQLMAELPPEHEPVYLVLDDYHCIHEESNHQAVQFILRHRPAYLTVVLLSRNMPPVGVAQLRMQGRLTEINSRQLALTHHEARCYLENRLAFELSPEAIERANRRVEGWFAALQLLASQSQTASQFDEQVEALTQGNQYLFHYFEELTEHQLDERQRHFLMRSATLNQFNAFLLMRLTGEADGQRLLNHLLSLGLFITSLDSAGLWYRYHNLFAVYLRHQQRCALPDESVSLHQKACDALLECDDYAEAARHAVIIRDQERLKRILRERGERFLSGGEFRLLQQCLDAMDVATINEAPLFTLLQAWVAQCEYRFSEVDRWLDDSESRMREQYDASQWAQIEAEFNAVRAQVAMNLGDHERAMKLASSALGNEYLHLPSSQTAARSVIGEALFVSGRLEEAREHILKAEQMAMASGSHQSVIWSLCQQSEIAVAQGFLQKAYNIQEKALQYAEQHALRIPIMEFLYRIRAQIMFEWYHLENAEKYALKGIELMESHGEHWGLQDYALLAKIAQARGRQSLCGDYMVKLQKALTARSYHMDWVANAHATMLSFWDASNDRESVERWLSEAPVHETRHATNHFLQCSSRNRARAYLSLGQLVEAESLLLELLAVAERLGLTTDINRNKIHLAQLYWMQDNRDAALSHMADALKLASTTGAIGSFLRIGKVLINILKALMQTSRLSDMERQRAERLIQLVQQQRDFSKAIRISLDEAIIQDIIDRPDVPELIRTSPLTRREWQVLSLIHAGFSNDQIASHLRVASTTVKTHIRSLYQKQNITHRSEAIALARDLLGKIQGE